MTTLLTVSPTPTEANDRLAATVASQTPRLRAIVRRQVADLAEVEDIIQDAFLELIATEQFADPIRHVAAWLERVARHRIIDRFRQRARSDRLFDRPSGGDPTNALEAHAQAPDTTRPDLSLERDRFAERLVGALDSLPAEQRDVFVAHELDGRSFKELAAATGVPVNTLLSRKHAAVLQLRRQLRDFGSTPID